MPDGGKIGEATGGVTEPLISGGVGGATGNTGSCRTGCAGGFTRAPRVTVPVCGISITGGDATGAPFTTGNRDGDIVVADPTGTAAFAGICGGGTIAGFGRSGSLDWHPSTAAPRTKANDNFRASCVMVCLRFGNGFYRQHKNMSSRPRSRTARGRLVSVRFGAYRPAGTPEGAPGAATGVATGAVPLLRRAAPSGSVIESSSRCNGNVGSGGKYCGECFA